MLAVRVTVALLLGACGRIGFDPLSTRDAEGGDATTADGSGSGLLLHFAFEADGLMKDRATGHDATCTTCPVTSAGVRSGTTSARFGGAACLLIPGADLSPPVVTFALWTKQADQRASSLFGKALMGATQIKNSLELYSLTGSSSIFVTAGGTTIQVSSGIGAWHHIAAVFDGSKLTAYVDGVLDSSQAGLPATLYAADPFRIGCDQNRGVEESYFVGDLDEVQLYGRALSAAEIQVLATP